MLSEPLRTQLSVLLSPSVIHSKPIAISVQTCVKNGLNGR